MTEERIKKDFLEFRLSLLIEKKSKKVINIRISPANKSAYNSIESNKNNRKVIDNIREHLRQNLKTF